MQGTDAYTDAWKGIRSSFESDRLAHAYVIVGSPRGDALNFAQEFLQLLYCTSENRPCNECSSCQSVRSHRHVDNLWIEPRSKSRQILAEDVRALIHRMEQTSFEGGWKAGVILSADCMNESSENALLKTLEEPPSRSILLLVTDAPQSLLPTIISRCQKIVLSSQNTSAFAELWYTPMMSLLSDFPPKNGLEAARIAGQMKGLLDTVKTEITAEVEDSFDSKDNVSDATKAKEIIMARINARLKEVQADLFRVLLDWHRDILVLASDVDESYLTFPDKASELKKQADCLTQAMATRAVSTIETMAQRLDRNMSDVQVLDEGFRALIV